jgi:hypothetical protein
MVAKAIEMESKFMEAACMPLPMLMLQRRQESKLNISLDTEITRQTRKFVIKEYSHLGDAGIALGSCGAPIEYHHLRSPAKQLGYLGFYNERRTASYRSDPAEVPPTRLCFWQRPKWQYTFLRCKIEDEEERAVF